MLATGIKMKLDLELDEEIPNDMNNVDTNDIVDMNDMNDTNKFYMKDFIINK